MRVVFIRNYNWRVSFKSWVTLFAVCLAMMCPQTVCHSFTGSAQGSMPDLTELSIEELMNIQVTSVSRKAESLYDSAAAVYVVTQEDIRRSGATSIPEALRMVPGLQVAKTNGNTWVVTSRGFADRWANKLLVLIDGRNVYTPLFSGVYWDVQDYVLEDIDRIEVIRGPGATMWGANAVNGIINIITKSASDTQGGLAVAGAGREERWFSDLRYGGELGTKGTYRVYAKHFSRNDTGWRKWGAGLIEPDEGGDSWNQTRAGFRSDLNLNKKKSLTIQGDMYGGTEQQVLQVYYLTQPYKRNVDSHIKVAGGNILARMTNKLSDNTNESLQFYYDRIDRREMQFGEHRNTFDIDFQRNTRTSAKNEVTWGLGYRYTQDSTDSSFWVNFDPDKSKQSLFSALVQDEITLKPDKFRLTLGSKLEHNSFTGFELQPNIRALWTPDKRNTYWAAISRAVRTPSRWEISGRVNDQTLGNPSLPNLIAAVPNPDFDSEDLLAYELGYRTQPSKTTSLDVATFYNIYRHLRTFAGATPFLEMTPSPPHIVLPLEFENQTKGRTLGMELSGNWDAARWWRLSAGCTFLRIDLTQDPSSLASWLKTPVLDPGDGSPSRQYSVRSYMDLPCHLEFDAVLYAVGPVKRTEVPSYKRLDLRLGWRPKKDLDISLIEQNVLDYAHREFDAGLDEKQTDMQRSLFLKVTWGF
jgi:iron complex outermembrane recepter protein